MYQQTIEPRPVAGSASAAWFNPRLALRRAWAANWSLTLLGLAMLVLLLVCLAGLALDPRMITGAPAWLKPMKFAISIALYSCTLLWLLTFVQGHPLKGFHLTNEGLPDAANCRIGACQDLAGAKFLRQHWNAVEKAARSSYSALDPF
jgi:hypothetical protein